MTRTALISVLLALAPLGALACSPSYVETPGPLQRGPQCSLVQPQQIGDAFAEPAIDLGAGRVAQVYGTSTGCDLNSSVVVTQCNTGARLTIGPDPDQARGNGGGVLLDIKASLAPEGQLDLAKPLPKLAATAAGNGHDVTWIDDPWEVPRAVFADWGYLTCACATFYPGSEGAN